MIINRVFQILKVILYILLILLLIGAQAIEMMRTYVPKNTDFFKKYENVSGKINYPSSNKEISILFLGDSFVNGVGGSKKQIEKNGPPLARYISSIISKEKKINIIYQSLSKSGANIIKIRKNLSEKIEKNFDYIVILCGGNDFKKFSKGEIENSPYKFRRNLEEFIEDIKKKADNPVVFLPGYPTDITIIDQPLRFTIKILSNIYDNQKKSVCKRKMGCIYLNPMTKEKNLILQNNCHKFISDDGIHPNDLGYFICAKNLAENIMYHMKPTRIPEKPTRIPEKPTRIPEKPTRIPEKPTGIPEKPTRIPEKPTRIPENP